MPIDSIAVILLAAGASVRLGTPKQLLQIQGETLLWRTAKYALAVSNRVVVTLGANVEPLRKEIEDLPVKIVDNRNWESGMSSSIKCGLEELLTDGENLQAVIVMVCDQPFADEKLLAKIITAFQETNASIIACKYENTLGVPALFHENLFPELLALDEKSGAKHLIKKYVSQTGVVDFPEGAFDVDTPGDYEKLLAAFN